MIKHIYKHLLIRISKLSFAFFRRFLALKIAFLFTLIMWISFSFASTVTEQISTESWKVSWTNDGWTQTKQQGYTYIQAGKLAYHSEEGAPLLPFDEIKIAIPEGGSITISGLKEQSQKVLLDQRILPCPKILTNDGVDSYEYYIDETKYNTYTQLILEQLPIVRYRKLTFSPIRINPFRYDGKYTLTVTNQMEFIITISGNTNLKSLEPLDNLSNLISNQLINPAQAIQWQSTNKPSVNYADFSRSDWWIQITTDRDGIFKITPSQLSMLPLNDIDPATFRIFTTGGEVQSTSISYLGPEFREIPIFVSGYEDGLFNGQDYILFYGRDRDGFEMNQAIGGIQYYNPYSKEAVYWLTFGGSFTGSPLRINLSNPETNWDTIQLSTPEFSRLETETYQRLPVGFDWYMSKLFGTASADYQYTINLEDVDTAQAQTISMYLRQEYLRNGSTTNHRLRLTVNGSPLLTNTGSVQEWNWIGMSPITITHTNTAFVSGANNIVLSLIRYGTDNLFLDYIQVDYQKQLIKRNKAFKISIPSNLNGQRVKFSFTGNNTNIRIFKTDVSVTQYYVVEIPVTVQSGGFYFISDCTVNTVFYVTQPEDFFVPTSLQKVNIVDLTQVNDFYDNIIITPDTDAFYTRGQNLANFYLTKWHKRSKVVRQKDIFNQFNGGMPDPAAIRQYLRYCVENYPSPSITSVTLLGVGTLDWRNFSGQSTAKNQIMVYQKGTVISDDYFAMFNTSQYPELAIGRYPVKNVSDFDIMFNNLQNYVDNPQPGLWSNTLLFVADDEYNGAATGEYYHSTQMQSAAALISKGVLTDKIFAIEYDFDEFQNKPKARDDMFKAINDGKLMWYYIGHGSYDKLGSEDYFNGAVDMFRFNNTGKLTQFIAASCDIAQFDNFGFDCLAEKVLFLNNAGAISSIAATRECLAFDNVPMISQYMNYSVNMRNPTGYSLVMGKIAYTSNNQNDEKYVLLGDPLLPIVPPARDSSMVISTNLKPTILHSRERANISGSFPALGLYGIAEFTAYNCETVKYMGDGSVYTQRGGNLFKGEVTVTNSQYSAAFIVPDDVNNGNNSIFMAYHWNAVQKKGYVNYFYPIILSDQAALANNPDSPTINLFLESEDFRSGDTVGTNPLLIAKLSDSNGINSTNAPGHGILLILDYTAQPINVTNFFRYDRDSFTQGTLTYQFTNLSEGLHTLQLIAFDNFNSPSVARVDFKVKKTGKLSLERLLPYPNPMKKDGYITFILSEDATVKATIYTLRGRKIRTITANATKGFNSIYWDGKDADGDYLANNTYFLKVTAISSNSKSKIEKTLKIVIYH